MLFRCRSRLLRSRTVGTHHARRGRNLPVHAGDGFENAHPELRLQELPFDHELVARLNDALEAGVVDAGKVEEALLRIHVLGQARKRDDGAGLGHRFNDENARHYRSLGEVSGELRLVHRDVLDRHDAVEFIGELDNAVNQEKRIPVGQLLHDVQNVEALRHGSDLSLSWGCFKGKSRRQIGLEPDSLRRNGIVARISFPALLPFGLAHAGFLLPFQGASTLSHPDTIF